MTLDVRTPAQRVEDARNRARRLLECLLDWLIDAPPDLIAEDDRAAIVSRYLGHQVDPAQVRSAVVALKTRDCYQGSDESLAEDQSDLDAALDVLLDLFDCADCGDVHGPDGGRRECDHGEFCYEGFAAFHAGRPCPSERLS